MSCLPDSDLIGFTTFLFLKTAKAIDIVPWDESIRPGTGGAPGTACILPRALATPGGMFAMPDKKEMKNLQEAELMDGIDQKT